MPNRPNPSTPEPEAGGLAPGVSFYQVLEPSKILAANGQAQYAMVGPFLDLDQAAHYAASRPGALITVTLVLRETQAAAPVAAVIPARRKG